MKWWTYVAFKQLFPSGRGVSFFAVASILGVALGVMALFGTQSVMNGFHSQIAEKLKDTTGDVLIEQGGRPIYNECDQIISQLKLNKNVSVVEKSARGLVMMIYNNIPSYPLLKSYDTIEKKSALPLKEKGFIKNGSIDDLDDDSIILGIRLASTMRARVGDQVEVYSPTMLEKLEKNEVPLPVKLKVVGLLQTTFTDVDSNIAIVSLRRMRDLYSLGNGYHSLIMKLNEGVDETVFANSLNGQISDPLYAYTWLTSNSSFLRVILMEKVMMSVIIVLIIIVASFSICVSLYTSVLRKTKEVGLFGAMGARPIQIALSFCLQGFIIGICGAFLGIMFTFILMYFREPIVELIVGREALIQFYHFAKLPVKYDIIDGLRTSLFAVGLCTIAGLMPAIRASRLKISEAMRSE